MPKVNDDVVIIGIGETPVGSDCGMAPVHIQAKAVTLALQDAGLRIRDVDGLINQDPYTTGNSMFSLTLVEYLGASVSWSSTVDVGGMCSALTMLQMAVWAIASGHCEVAAVVFGENLRSSRPKGSHGFVPTNATGPEEFEEPFGVQGNVCPYAMIAHRFIHETGAQPRDFGEVAVVTRRHALLNDNAMMKKPMTMEDYLASRMICDPIRLFDCSIPSDGGGAFVLTTRVRAKRMNARAVGIRSLAIKTTHNGIANIPDIKDYKMGAAGEAAFEAAGLGPSDIDVALIHDAFTVSVLLTLEALGFARLGESGNYMRSGAATLGGRCPLNPHGGLLSQGHAGGIFHPVEAVRQLRWEAGRRQVDGVRNAVVAGNGGYFGACGVMVMGRI